MEIVIDKAREYILALKEADCSIAMASGSEATRNIANNIQKIFQ